jgi:hypothetical protein
MSSDVGAAPELTSEPETSADLEASNSSPKDDDNPAGEEEDIGTELVEIDLSPDERNRVIQELLFGQRRTSDPLDDL